jgi:plastocyanin
LVVGALSASGCKNDGTQPAGPPTDVVVGGGDRQNWYYNNPLPTPLSVTVLDPSGRPVPGVAVMWTVTSGAASGAVNPAQSRTDVSGVATTTDSVGSSTRQTVNATFTGALSAATFSEFATSAPTNVGVSVTSFVFTPRDTIVQSGGMVTWTWNSGTTAHNVTYTSGPTPLPNSPDQAGTTTFSTTFTDPGTYTYHCTLHPQMTGSVQVLH